MTIICSIILFTTWCFSFLNAICISKAPGHYINRKIQTSTARTLAVGVLVMHFFNSKEFTYQNGDIDILSLFASYFYCCIVLNQ
jgi:hypothetical protein